MKILDADLFHFQIEQRINFPTVWDYIKRDEIRQMRFTELGNSQNGISQSRFSQSGISLMGIRRNSN